MYYFSHAWLHIFIIFYAFCWRTLSVCSHLSVCIDISSAGCKHISISVFGHWSIFVFQHLCITNKHLRKSADTWVHQPAYIIIIWLLKASVGKHLICMQAFDFISLQIFQCIFVTGFHYICMWTFEDICLSADFLLVHPSAETLKHLSIDIWVHLSANIWVHLKVEGVVLFQEWSK